MTLETIKIVTDNEDGFKVINKDDFDPKTDKEYKVSARVKKAPAKPRKKKEE